MVVYGAGIIGQHLVLSPGAGLRRTDNRRGPTPCRNIWPGPEGGPGPDGPERAELGQAVDARCYPPPLEAVT